MSAPDAKPFVASSPPLVYRVGLVLVVLGMLVLPLVYLALTALACWWVWFFATHYFLAIWQIPLGYSLYGLVLRIILAFTPLLVGGAIALAMVKPLFARRRKRMHPLVLQPKIEPRLYALVQEVCRMVGAPAPHHIALDCNLNASAGFRRGFLSFAGQDLVLTLGLPLIAGLSERELAGVIAHEFGHFRQGVAMRLSYLIRWINLWFLRVVYERDAWDAALAGIATADVRWIRFMAGCTRAGVGLSRRILWLLMMAGHAMSGFLQRQMEFDADRWEMRVAGSAGFESTMLRLATLDYVLNDIRREMVRTWKQQQQLPDNLPLLVEYRTNHLPADRRAKVENHVGLGKTGWLDTHPSATDRIREARRCAEPGVFTSDAPARELLENFETVSHLVTLAHYQDDLNVPTTPEFLIPLEALIKEANSPKPAEPAAKPPPVPMMTYDPSKFRKPAAQGGE